MENIETVIGILERVKSSRNGNPRWRMTISSGDYQCVLCYTTPDSSLGYTMGNYRTGDGANRIASQCCVP